MQVPVDVSCFVASGMQPRWGIPVLPPRDSRNLRQDTRTLVSLSARVVDSTDGANNVYDTGD